MRSDLALAALASAAVPGMKPVSVAEVTLPVESGNDHQQAVVEDATGRRWTVRAPLTEVAGARLQRNDELVRQLSRHLPFKVPAPVGYASVGRHGFAVVHPHVEGHPLDFDHLPAGPGLASAVGRAVAAIHNAPREVFEQQDVPVFDAEGCRQRLIAEVDRAAETGRVPTGLLARWEEAFEAPGLWQFAPTPVHGNLTGDALRTVFSGDDAASGRIVAVLDWEDALVGDPAIDLSHLVLHASPEAWASVLESYAMARAHRPDPHLTPRARLVAEVGHLSGLAGAVERDDLETTQRLVEALRRIDRLTEDDESLVPSSARGVTGPLDEDGQRVWSEAETDRADTHGADLDEDGADEAGDDAADRSGTAGHDDRTDDVEHEDLTGRDEEAGAASAEPSPSPSQAITDVVPVPPMLEEDDEGTGNSGVGEGTVDDESAVEDESSAAPPAQDDAVDGRDQPDVEDPTQDLSTDEGRLSELYGMPDPEEDPGDESARHTGR